MEADIRSIVQDLKQVKIEQVVFEAITNAIQADATLIKVYLEDINKNLDLNEDKAQIIQTLKVVDNGHGFTKKDIVSFKRYRSTYKKKEFGSKGIGRFLYLKLFNKITLSSLENIITLSESSDVEVTKSTKIYPSTTLSLTNPTNAGGYQTLKIDFPIKIKEHFLPYFKLLKESKKKVTIEIYFNGKLGNKINSENVPAFINDSFQVDDHSFEISYLLNHPEYMITEGVYCADNRVVTCNTKLDTKSQFKSFFGVNFFYLLTSKYFDENLNDERDEFTIKPKQINQSNIFTKLAWDDIHQQLSEKIKDVCLSHGIDIEAKANEYLTSAIKKAPYLVNYFSKNEYGLQEIDLIKNAKVLLEKDKTLLRDNQKNKNSTIFKTTLNKVVQAELAEYIFDRQKIIANLHSLVDDNKLEKRIHNLFMKQYTEDHRQDYRTNNLWLFDDRFMSYDKVFSEAQIKTIFPELSKNIRKPDILSIVSNTYDGDKITDIVIIELKKPDASNAVAIAESELLRYSRYVNDSRSTKIRIWTYAFLSFDDETLLDLNDKSYNQLPTQNSYPICYKYSEKHNTIINFIDYKSLASDANSRNKTFLNILKGKNHISSS